MSHVTSELRVFLILYLLMLSKHIIAVARSRGILRAKHFQGASTLLWVYFGYTYGKILY